MRGLGLATIVTSAGAVLLGAVPATEELDSASTALGGTITWAFGRSTNSQGVVSNLSLRNG